MITLLQMTAAFAVILGVALIYVNILKLNIGESYVLSTVTLIAVIYLTGMKADNLMLGRNIFCGLAAAGVVMALVQVVRKKFDWGRMGSAYLPILFGILVLNVLLFYGDYIRYIDDFHMWAAAPKYMLDSNRLPIYDDFAGVHSYNIGTCIFNYFFQSFTGYNEGMMYSAVSLLSWIGILLPVSNNKKNNSFSLVLIYIIIMFFSIPILYVHGFKSVYVDVPTAGWFGGLAGWVLKREKRLYNLPFIGIVICMGYAFKDNIGLTLGVFFIVFFSIRLLAVEHKNEDHINEHILRILLMLILGITILLAIGFVYLLENYDLTKLLPEFFKQKLLMTSYSFETIKDTVRALMNMVIGKSLGASVNKLKISFMTITFISFVLLYIYGFVSNRMHEASIYIVYGMISSIIYILLTLYVYVFGMSDVYAKRAWASHRYLAIFAIYYFILVISVFLFSSEYSDKGKRIIIITSCSLLLFFIYGIRSGNIVNYSGYISKINQNDLNIQEQKEQALMIQEVIGKEQKVYFLNQKSDRFDEYGMNPAFYYMGNQINHVWSSIWKYTKNGAVIEYYIFNYNKLTDFPNVLTSGNYSYLWIYKTDDYLNNMLPAVLPIKGKNQEDMAEKNIDNNKAVSGIDENNPADIMDGQLYKIIYDNQGLASGLQLEKNLVLSNNRTKHRIR